MKKLGVPATPLSSALRNPTAEQRRVLAGNLATELGLTPAQEDSVTAILDRRAGDYQQLRNTIRPLVDQLTTEIHTDIERVLTPEQRERYEAIQQRKAQLRGPVASDSAQTPR